MPAWAWSAIKWALLAELVLAAGYGADLWVTTRARGVMNQSLLNYHTQYVQPMLKEREKK